MPPKVSKKAVKNHQEKVISDKTFGLKNKNRSAKVQAYCAQVASTVKSGNRQQQKTEAEREAARVAKEAKKEFEAAMQRMMGTADKKKSDSDSEDEEAEEEQEEEQNKNLGVKPEDYLWTADDFDEVEYDEGRLEEQLEMARESIKRRDDLHPVTEESFKAWREKKKADAAAKEQKRLEAAKAGKGKMRGWDLWQAQKELFVDDADADEEYTKEFDDAALFEGDDDEEYDLDDGGAPAAAASAAASADGSKKDKKGDEDNNKEQK